MTSLNRHWSCVIIAVVFWVGACKPPEPTPSQYVDLGTADAPLPPPPPAWHDPTTAKGTAEWRPFRKPTDANEKSPAAKPANGEKPPATGDAEAKNEAAVGSDAEKEIRSIAADFNAALSEKKWEEASEFLTDAQAEKSGEVFAAVNQLIEQLTLLQAAAPGLGDKITALLPSLNLAESLKADVQSVHVIDARSASAKLAGGGEARFEVGEKGLWYVESPMLSVLEKELSRIEKATKDIQEALAKGNPDEAATTALGSTLVDLQTALAAKPAEGGGA